MKKISILSAIIGLLVYGCSSNEEIYNNYHKEGDKSFRVTVEQPVCNETRAQLDNDYKVVFENNDKIAVFENNTAKSEYTYSSSETKFIGTSSIEGEALEGIFALYPHSATTTYNSGILPAEQAYRESSFSNESQIMYGQTDDIAKGFNLKNMCGYIRLHLYGENVLVKEITLSVTGEGEYVSGDFQIGASDGGDDYALTMKNEGENQKQSVKLVCPEGGVELGATSENASVFYIALPPQKYKKGFSVTITDIFGRDVTYTAFKNDGFTLERNHIKPMEALKIDEDLQEVLPIEEIEGKQYAQIDSPERLLKWGYTVNNFNYALGFVLQGDINMPLYEIEEDPANKTYKITGREITVIDGIPSGSNWIPVGTQISSTDLTKAFKGNIDGQNNSIIGLCINSDITGVGLVGCFCNGIIKDLSLIKSYVKGGVATGGVVGYCRYNSTIENVSIIDCNISGTSHVGGVVGYIYRRTRTGDETIPYIINCEVYKVENEKSMINGTTEHVGGICGFNYGAAIIHCTNYVDVTGQTSVGGVVGLTRSYFENGVSGYVIASGTTSDATITATSGYAGGIAGTSFLDGTHLAKGSDSYIVACYSNSKVVASNPGTMLGSKYTGTTSSTIATWAQKYGVENYNGKEPSMINLIASGHYSVANEITPNIVEDMNEAIDDYNGNVKDVNDNSQIKCHYKWQYNAAGWPTLVPITSSGND